MKNMVKKRDRRDTLFVHSGFRTSSTWLWLKLRKANGIRAYYEPFNQVLATMSKIEAGSFGPESWNSHHPVADPYFLEFIDLISESGGIPQFKCEMALENHIPLGGVDGELSKSEVDYLCLLIDSAHAAGRRPALCDTRSLGRSRAINRNFGGTHILLTRNLHEQWCSFSEQADTGDNSFRDSIFFQIQSGKHDPFLRKLAEILEKRAEAIEDYEIYVLFLLSQLYLNAVAFDVCKIKIDATKIMGCAATRADAEMCLSQALNSQIDLGDVKTHVSFSSLEANSRNSAEKLARQLLAEMSIPNASNECERFLQRTFDDAFKCWDQSIYYGEASRKFLSKKINSERRKAADEAARLNDLCNHLQTDLTNTKYELSQVLDVIQRRPRPLWEMLVFRRSGKPKKTFRRILFHKSGKPRGIFQKLILSRDGRPRTAFNLWMSSREYQNLRGAVRVSVMNHRGKVTLSPDAQQVARRVAALRPQSSRI